MLVAFIDMGLRLNELVNALLEDLDMKNRSLKVNGKGAKERKVYFGKRGFRSLRHTSATLAVENGLTAFQLKSQFGWEEIDTALRYVHLSDKSLEESYRNSSPLDNLST